MKKLLVLCSLLISVLAFSFTVKANGGFVDSPSLYDETELAEDSTGTYNKNIALSGFGNRDQLPEEVKAVLEEAYNTIKEADSVSQLNDTVDELLEDAGLENDDIAISELFDISASEESNSYKVKIKLGSASYFFCLLHYTNGGWEVVSNASLDTEDNLTFEVDSLSPFAVVVINNPLTAVTTQNYLSPWVYLSLAFLCTTMFFALKYTTKNKKKSM